MGPPVFGTLPTSANQDEPGPNRAGHDATARRDAPQQPSPERMNPERWQAIGDVFERAVLLPDGDQTAFVAHTCADDAELRHEVASLLASHRAASGGFVQHRIHNALSLFFDATNVAEKPVRVGPYRLIRELGRGGMGAVFLAERDDDHYHAQVAIKLVRPGMDTDFILARFKRERQTLARLQHPHISRLLDGGTT